MIPLETPDVANILSKNFTLRVVNFFGHCINIAGKYSQQKTSFTKLHEEEEEVEEEPFAFYLKNKTKSTEKVLPFLLFFLHLHLQFKHGNLGPMQLFSHAQLHSKQIYL